MEDAEESKQRLAGVLRDQLKLDRSPETPLTTHARTQAARFLTYAICVQDRDDLLTNTGRNTNGTGALRIAAEVGAASLSP